VDAADEIEAITQAIVQLMVITPKKESDFIEAGLALFEEVSEFSPGDVCDVANALKDYGEASQRDAAQLNDSIGQRTITQIWGHKPSETQTFVPVYGIGGTMATSGIHAMVPEFLLYRIKSVKACAESRSVTKDFRRCCDSAAVQRVDSSGKVSYLGPTHNGDITFRTPEGSTHCRTEGAGARAILPKLYTTPVEGTAGHVKIMVLRSWSRKETYLHMTEEIADLIANETDHFAVYNSLKAKTCNLSLGATTKALLRLEQGDCHVVKRMQDYGWKFTKGDVLKALQEAKECTISDGITLSDPKEAVSDGVSFGHTAGAHCNRLTIKASLVVKGISTAVGAVRQDVPCDAVLSLVETIPYNEDTNTITGVAIFFITIMPKYSDYRLYSHTGASFHPGDYAPSVNPPPLVRIIGPATEAEALKVEEKELSAALSSGDGWLNLKIRPDAVTDTSFHITKGAAELADAKVFIDRDPDPKKNGVAVAVSAMKATIANLASGKQIDGSGRTVDISPECVERVLTKLLIPSVGPGASIWHPAPPKGNQKGLTLDLLLIRCFLCFTCSYCGALDQSTLFIHNQWRAATTRVPACIFPRGVLWYGVAPHFVAMMIKECGTGQNFSHLREMKGGLLSEKGTHVTAADYAEFHFGVVYACRVGPVFVPRNEVVANRLYSIDPQGSVYSHDLQIADASDFLQRRSEERVGAGLDPGCAIMCYTNCYCIVATYSKTHGHVTYFHGSVRGSHITPTYHASRAVTLSEGAKIKSHYASLGKFGALGYTNGLVRSWPNVSAYLMPDQGEAGSTQGDQLIATAGSAVSQAMVIVSSKTAASPSGV